MASTTIVFPDNIVTAYTSGNDPNTPLSPISSTPITSGGQYEATLPGGFVLYITSSAASSQQVDVESLIQKLNNGSSTASTYISPWLQSGSWSHLASSATNITMYPGYVVYVPVTTILPSSVNVGSLASIISGPAVPLPSSSSRGASTGSASTSSFSPSVTSFSSHATTPATPPSHSVKSVLSQTSATSDPTVAPPSGTSPAFSKTTFIGAVAGGSLGGFIFGAAAFLLITFCCFRRTASRNVTMRNDSKSANHRGTGHNVVQDKEAQVFAHVTDVSGWQKHLPQEKDDGTIIKAFNSLFDHVQFHVEGFYETKMNKIPSNAISSLDSVSPDGLAKRLLEADDAVPLLAAILIRWIIHRISCRSEATDSLLPLEYAKIPEKTKWHMESRGGEKSFTVPRRGFSEAFSQWRTLTGFLFPDPKTDQEYKRRLDANIERATQAFIDAFSPWESSGKNPTNKAKGLRNILQQGSDVGILVFTQPSTFMFDWPSERREQSRSIPLSPSVTKVLDELARPLHPAQVLVEARWT